MSVLDLSNDASFDVKWGESNYSLSRISMSELGPYLSLLKKADEIKDVEKKNEKHLELSLSLIEKAGLPKEVISKLPARSVMKLVTEIIGEKKS